MLAKTREENCSGYSGSLRTYSNRQVPDMSSGPEGGMLENLEIRELCFEALKIIIFSIVFMLLKSCICQMYVQIYTAWSAEVSNE